MWLNVPSTYSPSVPVAADSITASDWRFQLLARSVWSSGKDSPSRNWYARWKKGGWTTRLFGAICEPSTATRGVESWIASLEATRARTSHSPASERAWTALADRFGVKSLASLGRSNRLLCFSRTCRATSLWDGTRSPQALKEWATALRRACLRRRKSARLTSGSGCSSSAWPTADANEGNGGRRARAGCSTTGRMPDGSKVSVNLQASVDMLWPTARSEDSESCGNHPDATDSLTGATRLWTTPDSDPRQSKNRNRNVGAEAELWQTPQDAKGGGTGRSGDRIGEPLLDGQARMFNFSLPAPPTSTDGATSSPSAPSSPRPSTRRLNSIFVAWLQGWLVPVVTDSDFSETASCPSAPPGPSSTSTPAFAELGSPEWESAMRSELTALAGKASDAA